MKKILILVVALLLVGCQQKNLNVVYTYDDTEILEQLKELIKIQLNIEDEIELVKQNQQFNVYHKFELDYPKEEIGNIYLSLKDGKVFKHNIHIFYNNGKNQVIYFDNYRVAFYEYEYLKNNINGG